MSARTILIWLGLAVVLGAITAFVIRVPTGATQRAGLIAIGGHILDLGPSQIDRIIVRHGDGSVDTLERASGTPDVAIGSDAEWFVRSQLAARAGEAPLTTSPWPVAGPSMQGLLRKLADARCVALAAREATLGERPTRVEFVLRDGATVQLSLADRTLAGTGLVEVQTAVRSAGASTAETPTTTSRAVVADELHRVFTNPGPRAWRDRAVLSGLAADASRLRLENPRQRLALGRSDGRWSVREPAAAPANPQEVQRLLALLGRLEIDDFLDDGAPSASTGLESPSARIVLEADRRIPSASGGDPASVTVGVEIVVGAAADPSGRRVFASVNEDRLVLLDARPLAQLTLDPGLYMWPAPVRTPAAEIGSIRVRVLDPSSAGGTSDRPPTVFTRTLERWTRTDSGSAAARPLVGAELEGLNAALSFLTGEDRSADGGGSSSTAGATSPTITIDPPPDFQPAVSIDLRSLADAPLGGLELGRAATATLTIRSGTVYRTYPLNRVPAMLVEIARLAPARSELAGPPEPAIPTK